MTTSTITGKFTVTQFPKRTFAYVRNVGPYMGDSALFERLFNQVMAWAGPKGLMQRPGMESISVYHDDPEKVPAEKSRISVGFTVPEGTLPEGDIQIMELPAGKYAVGSFELLPHEYGTAWKEIYEFIFGEKLTPTSDGPVYESYKNDPRQHPEGRHAVDICVALK